MKKIFSLVALSLTCVMLSAQDATQYITNPSLEEGFDGWTNNSLASQSNNSFAMKAGNMYAEKWVAKGSQVGSASLKQTVVGLPLGQYRLTVGAQNLNQSNTSAQCEGAYIFAGEQQTPVYTPADYSVEFENLTGTVEIGFVASSAKGNWLAVDNFRLEKTGEVDMTQVYAALKDKIGEAEALYDAEKNEADALLEVIEQAKAMYNEQTATADEVLAMMSALDQAMFAFRIANGTGSSPKITKTDHYVATGATQALMRATISGSNILEKGICWSTGHNPTVFDSRSTTSYSLNGTIFHVKGLTPATVYYLRPYALTKGYKVAYGDEVKIVTHPKGNCQGTWDNGAPTADANTRCATAIQQTIEYFNEWTGIMGFTLSGHYGSGTPTADCSYGGWMRIGPNAAYQAIGTVLHETGHGVGVGTHDRWWDTNVHDGKWFGREATNMIQFLENKWGDSECYMQGDNMHGWGHNATYDWFVNGADKDKHLEIQYIGGCALLYAFFVDGLCPTGAYPNGLAGYTYNFDEEKRYYIMCKNANFGLNDNLLCEKEITGGYIKVGNMPFLSSEEEIPNTAAWHFEYNAATGCYMIKNAESGRYMTHSGTTLSLKEMTSTGTDEAFQLMPDRTDVTVKSGDTSIKTHGYWFTWNENGNKALQAHASKKDGNPAIADFNYANSATKQQWIILSEEEMQQLHATVSAIEELKSEANLPSDRIYDLNGRLLQTPQRGLMIVGGRKIIMAY